MVETLGSISTKQLGIGLAIWGVRKPSTNSASVYLSSDMQLVLVHICLQLSYSVPLVRIYSK